MQVFVATITPREMRSSRPSAELLSMYLERAARYTSIKQQVYPTESKLLGFLQDSSTRTRPFCLLTDSTGQQVSSVELATLLTQLFDNGIQTLVLAIGPADGWSPAARKRADKTIAFGRITLPHELAAVIAAEQLYRALTIRAGHPYHTGH